LMLSSFIFSLVFPCLVLCVCPRFSPVHNDWWFTVLLYLISAFDLLSNDDDDDDNNNITSYLLL
jgi:hypothetical protein